jgi:hypothetical protein
MSGFRSLQALATCSTAELPLGPGPGSSADQAATERA